MKGKELLGREIKCFNCGKPFISHEEWAYKKCVAHAERKFCSWKCLRETELKKTTKLDERDKIIRAIMDGLTNAEIAKVLSVDRARVVYWRKKLAEEDGHGEQGDNDRLSDEDDRKSKGMEHKQQSVRDAQANRDRSADGGNETGKGGNGE